MERRLRFPIDFGVRSDREEWMDSVDISEEMLWRARRDIRFMNGFLGTTRVMSRLLNRLRKEGLNSGLIVDAGCGAGDLTLGMALRPGFSGFDFLGVDRKAVSEDVMERRGDAGVLFVCADILEESVYASGVDVVMCNLFLHHFSEEALRNLLVFWKRMGVKYVIVNDLERNRVSFYGFRILSFLFGLGVVARYDGAVSVLRGFRRRELLEVFSESGWNLMYFSKGFPFRWEILAKNDG